MVCPWDPTDHVKIGLLTFILYVLLPKELIYISDENRIHKYISFESSVNLLQVFVIPY